MPGENPSLKPKAQKQRQSPWEWQVRRVLPQNPSEAGSLEDIPRLREAWQVCGACRGRKKAALTYVATYVIGCCTKHFNNFNVLLVGRIFCGVSTSLLFSAFESWLVAEHFKVPLPLSYSSPPSKPEPTKVITLTLPANLVYQIFQLDMCFDMILYIPLSLHDYPSAPAEARLYRCLGWAAPSL